MDILLIEDREEDAELTRLALLNMDFKGEIHWVRDGEDALKFLFENADQTVLKHIKLILLDLNLPKINGLELLKNIKKSHLKHIPIVMLTTSNQNSDIAEAYEHYVNSFVIKPVDFNEFQNLIAQLANYWIKVNNLPH